MHFEPNYTYHLFNRSNEKLFYSRENYLFFLGKIEKHLLPLVDILAYCLMPNHFHFLINAKKEACNKVNEAHRKNTQQLSKAIGTVLSSYTSAINKKHQRRGFLFSHNTKAKMLNFQTDDYARNCFFYIHQNPYNAGLVKRLEDWEFSSLWDYIGIRDSDLINKDLAYEIINFDKENLLKQAYTLLGKDWNMEGFEDFL